MTKTTTWTCDDSNQPLDITAETARGAAEEYVDGGDWGDDAQTCWVDITCIVSTATLLDRLEVVSLDRGDWGEMGLGLQAMVPFAGAEDLLAEVQQAVGGLGEAELVDLCADDEIEIQIIPTEETITISIEPDEPDCVDGEIHDWQTPIEIVGGIESNPGVQGHGGGVVCHECCMRCGCARITDSWAQRPDTGEQGLESVEYVPDHYGAEIAMIAKRAARSLIEQSAGGPENEVVSANWSLGLAEALEAESEGGGDEIDGAIAYWGADWHVELCK